VFGLSIAGGHAPSPDEQRGRAFGLLSLISETGEVADRRGRPMGTGTGADRQLGGICRLMPIFVQMGSDLLVRMVSSGRG
jgi:hypothetical protein